MTAKLIDMKTREEIILPARRSCWDGSEHMIRDFKPSRFGGNRGFVYTALNEVYEPSIFELEIIRDDELEAIGAGGLK